MSKNILLGLLGVVIVTALGSYFFLQSQRIAEQKETIEKQQTIVGTLTAINVAQNATIKALQVEQQQNDTLIVDAARQMETLFIHITELDNELQEALNNASALSIHSVLPLDASTAFCLQWYAASGVYTNPANTTTNATQSSYAGKGNTNSTWSKTTRDCTAWKRMTVRDAVEWNSLLLRHAGLERQDKVALRKWAEEQE